MSSTNPDPASADGCQRAHHHRFCKICGTYLHCLLNDGPDYIRRDTASCCEAVPILQQIREALTDVRSTKD